MHYHHHDPDHLLCLHEDHHHHHGDDDSVLYHQHDTINPSPKHHHTGINNYNDPAFIVYGPARHEHT